MWRSRLRATFLSNRDEVNAGDKPAITHKPAMTYTVCCAVVLFFFSQGGKTYSFAIFGLSVGWCELQMCMAIA